MKKSTASNLLGCQVWLEPGDSPEYIRQIYTRARESGLGQLRIMLLWPWVERQPGRWDFEVFDKAFDLAAEQDLLIKATLTANAPAWHVPPGFQRGVLHTPNGFLGVEQREPMRRYIQQCVERYANHPALHQWIIWSEPTFGQERTPETLEAWRKWVATAYRGDIEALNHGWLTGFQSFDEIPFPEDVPQQQRKIPWIIYEPWVEEWKFRSAWLVSQLQWVADETRRWDKKTHFCVNPIMLLTNRAAGGTDLEAMGGVVDVIGSSYHPAWLFTFARREEFPALMTAGVRLSQGESPKHRAEVTEVQCGNTLNSGLRPSEAEPAELARFIMAGLAGGAESVTGWLLNVRHRNFEAGDWGLLDDADEHSARSRMVRRLHDRMEFALERTGAWSAAATEAYVVSDAASQSIEWIEARVSPELPGRGCHDGAGGAALMAVNAMRRGFSTTLASLARIPSEARAGQCALLSHVVSWEKEHGERLARFAESGGTVLVDATCGRKTFESVMHRPWPGGLADRSAFRATSLATRTEGWEIVCNGAPTGRWLLARLEAELDPAAGWKAWPDIRFAYDGEPAVWERPLGRGRLIVARGMIGPSLIAAPDSALALQVILGRIGQQPEIEPVAGSLPAVAIPVAVERGSLWVVLAPDRLTRGGTMLRLRVREPEYLDLWTGEPVGRGSDGEAALPAEEGIALLWR